MTQQLEQFADRGMKAQAAVDRLTRDVAPGQLVRIGSTRLLEIDSRLKRITDEARQLRAERDKLERGVIDANKREAAEAQARIVAPLLPGFDPRPADANGNGQADGASNRAGTEGTAPPAPLSTSSPFITQAMVTAELEQEQESVPRTLQPDDICLTIQEAGKPPTRFIVLQDPAPEAPAAEAPAIERGNTYTAEQVGVHLDWLEQCVLASQIFPPAPDFKGGGGTIDSITRIAGRPYTVTGCSVRSDVVRYRLTPTEAAKDFGGPPITWKQVLARSPGRAPEDIELAGMWVADAYNQEWVFHAVGDSIFCEVPRAELGRRLEMGRGRGGRTWDEMPAPDAKPSPTPEHKAAAAAKHTPVPEPKETLHEGVGGYVAENPARLPIPAKPASQKQTWYQWRSSLMAALRTRGVTEEQVADVYPTGQALKWYQDGRKAGEAADEYVATLPSGPAKPKRPTGPRTVATHRKDTPEAWYPHFLDTYRTLTNNPTADPASGWPIMDNPVLAALYGRYLESGLRPSDAAREFHAKWEENALDVAGGKKPRHKDLPARKKAVGPAPEDNTELALLLLQPGTLIRTNYKAKPRRVIEAVRVGQTVSVTYVDVDAIPRRTGGWRDKDKRWINDIVLRDGKLTMHGVDWIEIVDKHAAPARKRARR